MTTFNDVISKFLRRLFKKFNAFGKFKKKILEIINVYIKALK